MSDVRFDVRLFTLTEPPQATVVGEGQAACERA